MPTHLGSGLFPGHSRKNLAYFGELLAGLPNAYMNE
jgi:hypothetical protein